MAGGLLEYSGLVTKTRAMKGRLLEKEDFERISEFQTVQETIGFLREQESYGRIYGGHEEIQHRGQVEALIHDSIWEDYRKLYRFANARQRRALNLFFEQFQFEHPAQAVKAPYFIKVWKEIDSFSGRQMRHVLREVFGTQIDWLNIMWIYRGKQFFHQNPQEIRKMLIPIQYKLKKTQFFQLLEAEETEAFPGILGNTAYFFGKEALVKLEDEISYRNVMKKMYERLCKKHPSSMAPVYYYFHQKEQEIQNLTAALEGIRYQLAAKDIRELILPHAFGT